jgi:hypothetical protein
MSAAPANPNQPLVTLWVVQMIGTLVIAGVALVFFRSTGVMFKGDPQWPVYALYAMFASLLLPLLYLRNFKEVLDADTAALKAAGGVPDPAIRPVLLRALRVGGALSELPQAFGVVHVMLGGETRWFLGATLVTIALRLAYRPFEKLR